MNEKTNNNWPLLLIVDDSADMRFFVRHELENDFQVIEAINGQDGFNKAQEQLPDIILADLKMPVMDGIEMTKKLKEEEKTKFIPVIVLTASQSDETFLDSLAMGVDDFIRKPFNANIFKIRLENILKTRNNNKE